ncbi:MAG: tail fiber domain-containing protein [Deltaproteobacteria bacterium]|nr:tail fiber domain-containing protein [Deltaproteobacteria bacterium]
MARKRQVSAQAFLAKPSQPRAVSVIGLVLTGAGAAATAAVRAISAALLGLSASVALAVDVPQSFSLDGRLFSDPQGTTALKDGSISVRLQVLDDDKACVLYEEQQTISTSASDGYFSMQVGSSVGATKRSASGDSGNDMTTIFSNMAPVSGKALADGLPCIVAPVGGKRRYVRMIISPSSLGGAARTLSPDLTIDSVPNALIAERAESIQGLRSSNLLQVNTAAGTVLTQSNLENLFLNSARFSAVSALVDGTSTSYMRSTSSTGAQLPVLPGAPSSTPTQGSIWYDSTDEKLKFQSSGGPVTLTTGTSGISALTGDVTASGTGSVAATVAFVGGSTAANVNAATVLANASTSANTASAIVRRDGSGGFSAGQVSSSAVRLRDATTNYVELKAPAAVTNYSLTLPSAVGASGQTLVTVDAAGTLGWTTPSSSQWTTTGSDIYYNTGNVGIGTATPSAKLDSIGVIRSTGNASTPSSGAGLEMYYTAGAGVFRAIDRGTATYKPLWIDSEYLSLNGSSTGHVGIGNGIPETKLHIKGSSTTNSFIRVDNTNMGAFQTVLGTLDTAGGGNGAGGFAGTLSNHPFALRTNNLDRLTIDTSGNVGIGIATPYPGSKLNIESTNGNYAGIFNLYRTSGTGSNTTGAQFNVGVFGGSTDQVTGVYINNQIVSTVTGNSYGLYIEGTSGNPSGTKFGIYQAGIADQNYFAGNVGIGTATPNASALFDVASTSKGVLLPRMTTVQRDAIATPANGLQIYNTTTNALNYYNGSSWQALGVAGSGLGSLGGQTGSTQTFAAGSTGTAPAISSSGDVHTLNVPLASGAGVTSGTISKAQYDTFDAKLTSPLTTKGDLLSRDGTSHVRLPAGTDGHVLRANSATASGLEWSAGNAGTVTNVTSANSYLSVATGSTTPALTVNVGTAANTVAAGDDSRITGALQTTAYSADVADAAGCTAAQMPYWSSVGDRWMCAAISGLPASAISTGTVASARLGSGTADSTTYLRGDGAWTALTGSQWTTTGSDIYYNTGNVGIGTISPGAPLTIYNAGFGDGQIRTENNSWSRTSGVDFYSGATQAGFVGLRGSGSVAPAVLGTWLAAYDNTPVIFGTSTGAPTPPSERMRIDSSGNVGVGTTSPTSILHAYGANTGNGIFQVESSTSGVVFKAGSSTGAMVQMVGTGGMVSVAGGPGLARLNVGSLNSTSVPLAINGVAGQSADLFRVDTTTGTTGTAFKIASSGNVGIGNTTPTTKLSVSGDIYSLYAIAGSGTTRSAITALPIAMATDQTADMIGVKSRPEASGVNSGRVIGFNAEINQSSVGKNMTSAIGYHVSNPFLVSGTITNTYGLYVDNLSSGTNNWAIYSAGSTPSYFGGNLGIGTAAPSSLLHLQKAGSLGLMIENTASTGYANLFLKGDARRFDIEVGASGVADIPNKFAIYDQTAGAYRLAIDTAGNVGIGTTSPLTPLHISKNQDTTTTLAISNTDQSAGALSTLALANGTHNMILQLSGAGAGSISQWYSNGPGGIYIDNGNAAGDINFRTGAVPTNKMTILNAGSVGIGTTSPQTTLQVAGVISPSANNTYTLGNATYRFTEVYATNGVINTSDRREKKDISDTDLGLDFINRLRPVSYRWNTGVDNDVHYGLIAQEAEQAIAEVGHSKKTSIVTHDEKTDRYGVRYSELISPLIKAVQELYNELLGVKHVNDAQDRKIASVQAEKADKAALIAIKAEADQLKAEIEKLNRENAAMRAYLCEKDKAAPICR